MNSDRGDTKRYEVIIALPVFVPLPNGYTITMTFDPDGIDAVTQLTFYGAAGTDSRAFEAMRRVAAMEWGDAVSEEGPNQAFPDRLTIVVATTPMIPQPDDSPHEELSDPDVIRILRLVDNLTEAYGLLTHQSVPRIGPTTLFHVLLTRTIDEHGKPTPASVSVLDTEATARRRVTRLLPMSLGQRTELARIAARLDRVRLGRPYYTSVRLIASAERSLIDREPEGAIVAAASAVESMANEMLGSLAEEDSVPGPRGPIALKNLLTQHLLRRLGLSAEEPAVGVWLREGYELRHRVVHEGVSAKLSEALAAVRAADALSRRLDEALVGLVDRYPRTAARKIGQSLLGKVEATAELRDIVESETAGPLQVGIVQDEI